MKIVVPTGTEAANGMTWWPEQPTSLDGLTVALIDNTKPNASRVLHWVAEDLASRYGVTVRTITKPGTSGASPEALDSLAEESGAVLAALGE